MSRTAETLERLSEALRDASYWECRALAAESENERLKALLGEWRPNDV